MTPETIIPLFTGADGSYLFARWERPIVPVVFGLAEETLPTLKGAIEAVVTLAGHKMAETDPELGANLMVFFIRDWSELTDTPNLDRLIPDLPALVARLSEQNATQYRFFRFEPHGPIRACFSFVRMDAALEKMPAGALCLQQAVQAVLLWSERAFADRAPLARTPEGHLVLHPDIAAIIAAAYDRVMPPVATDSAHAFRLAARVTQHPEAAPDAPIHPPEPEPDA